MFRYIGQNTIVWGLLMSYIHGVSESPVLADS